MCWKTILVIAIIYIALVYLFENLSWGSRWNVSEAFSQSMSKLKKKRIIAKKNIKKIQENYSEEENQDNSSSNEYDSEHESEESRKELLEHIDQINQQQSQPQPQPQYQHPTNRDLMAQNLNEMGPLPLGSFGGNSVSSGDMDLGNLETFNGSFVSMGNHYNSGYGNGTGVGAGNIVESVNYYPSNEGIANFGSDAYNIKQFFKTANQQEVERDIQNGNGITNKKHNTSASPKVRKTSLVVPDYHNPPTQWNYENDLVMNGAPFIGDVTGPYGSFKGHEMAVTGYNTDDNSFQYESFNTPTPNSDILKYNYDNLAPKHPKRRSDDLRMGMGKPAASIRAST
jgi:hypothetical protein